MFEEDIITELSSDSRAESMERTKIQLATSYSPGVLFTFENNLVICHSIPKSNYDATKVIPYTRDQIFKNIEERVKAWYGLAINIHEHIKPQMCVDKDFLDNEKNGIAEKLDKRLFGFVEPDNIGYEPTLLTMVCSRCKQIKVFENLKDFKKRHTELQQKNCCDGKILQKCSWHQMDIVFVHPNGNWRQPLPFTYEWSEEKQSYYKKNETCSNCGNTEVKLDDRSSQIGKYFFVCTNSACRKKRPWLQNDKEYIREYGSNRNFVIADLRMKPISYRASSVHYTQQDMVIDFGESNKLDILKNQDSLENHLIDKFSVEKYKLSNEDKKEIIIKVKGDAEWINYKSLQDAIRTLKTTKNSVAIQELEKRVTEIEKNWENESIFSRSELSENLRKNLYLRQEIYASKYDPFRLMVEHEALLEKVVNNQLLNNGLRRFIPLDDLDADVGPVDQSQRMALNKRHREILDTIGIETLGLVREFKTVHYSFGFTRVGASPTIEYINNRIVPVRLNLFPKARIDSEMKHPIFVLKQDNEAIYVKLNENNVREWLKQIDPLEGVSDDPIELQYLMHAPRMSTFLDTLPSSKIAEKPLFSLALYTLLHTYAHHVMISVSEYSGLGVNSLGEYLFPANMAFIIYRRGMTMDLGNLNALLRNNTPAFLEHLANYRNLGCGSGSLCLSRGGACPNCLLIPEISCITQNKLLSRSVLVGKDSPRNYGFNKRIPGYFDTVIKKGD